MCNAHVVETSLRKMYGPVLNIVVKWKSIMKGVSISKCDERKLNVQRDEKLRFIPFTVALLSSLPLHSN